MSFPRVLGGIHKKCNWIPTFVGMTVKSGNDNKSEIQHLIMPD